MKPHALYRFFDATGRLLYIGITMNPANRWDRHSDDKPWWSQVARIAIETLPSRADALDAERRAIQAEQPLHNVIHNVRKVSAAPAGLLNDACFICRHPVRCAGYVILYGSDLRPVEEWWRAFDERTSAAEVEARARGRLHAIDVSDLCGGPDDAPWRLLHATCDDHEDSGDYWLEIAAPLTVDQLLMWTLHLSEKDWVAHTNWRSFVYQLVSETTRRRFG